MQSKNSAIYLLFFLSGLSALIYEIAWLNRIQLIMGYTIYALSTVLGAYLSGLAVGALAAHRIPAGKRCLNLYLFFELAIGLYGVLFSTLLGLATKVYSPLVTDTQVPLPVLSLIQFFFCGLVIFVPTFLMGATLPLLAKHLFETTEELAEKIGRLYGVNTLGAFAGALLCGYVLLPELGYSRTMFLGAAINAFLFLLALIQFPAEKFSLGDLFPKSAAHENADALLRQLKRSLSNGLVWILFLSGALSVLVQLLWNRLAALSFGPSVYVFPLVTSTVLLGIFLGSLLSSRFAATRESIQRFLGINMLLAIPLLGIGHYLFGKFPLAVLWLNSALKTGHGSYVLFQFLLMFIVVLPGATALGAIFPAALSLFAREEASDPTLSVGFAYGMNIAGVLFGALIGGFALIPLYGLDTLNRSVFLGLLLALLLLLERNGSQWVNYGATALLAFIALSAVPPFDRTLITSGYFYNRIRTSDVKDYETYYDSLQSFHDMYRYALVDYKDDAHGTISIHEYVNDPQERWFRIDGKTDGNRRGDVATVQLLDYLPQLFRPNFEKVLTIGLGTGESASLTAEIPGMLSSKVIELSPSMIEFSRKYFPENSYHVWKDPRIQVLNRDGREFLLHTEERFDLILSEPSNPWVNGVASLFTKEFFQNVAEHLPPGGVASVWFHSYGLSCDAFDSVMMAAHHAFKNLVIFKRSGDFYIIASNDRPLEIQPQPHLQGKLGRKILTLLDGQLKEGDVTEELMKKLNEATWVKNRAALERYARYGRYNSDDNQFLQYSGGRTYRRGISCYMSY